MSFDPNIPQASNIISSSQAQILANFQQLDSQYGTAGDHIEWSAASNNGKHKKSTYIEQSGDQSTSANEMAVYCKDVSTITELFVRRASNGNAIQLTKGTPTLAANGATFLPGGLLLQWNTVSATAGGAAVSFLNAFTTVYTATIAGTANSAFYLSISGGTVTAFAQGGPLTAYVIAIGV